MFVVVYVPTSKRNDPWVQSAVKDAVGVFGGMTEVEGKGHWIDEADDEQADVVESVNVLSFATAYGTLSADEGIAIRTVVNALIRAGEQAVAIVVNNNLHMFMKVDPDLLPIIAY